MNALSIHATTTMLPRTEYREHVVTQPLSVTILPDLLDPQSQCPHFPPKSVEILLRESVIGESTYL